MVVLSRIPVSGQLRVASHPQRTGFTPFPTRRRPIDHWLFFHTEADLNAAAAKVGTLGYTVSDSGRIEQEEDHPSYRLQLSKNAPLTDIDNDTWELIDIAQENNGDYDGWGSILVQ